VAVQSLKCKKGGECKTGGQGRAFPEFYSRFQPQAGTSQIGGWWCGEGRVLQEEKVACIKRLIGGLVKRTRVRMG
jgi:hypothetical protein